MLLEGKRGKGMKGLNVDKNDNKGADKRKKMQKKEKVMLL